MLSTREASGSISTGVKRLQVENAKIFTIKRNCRFWMTDCLVAEQEHACQIKTCDLLVSPESCKSLRLGSPTIINFTPRSFTVPPN